jgi:putative sigma-54 modulation protein
MNLKISGRHLEVTPALRAYMVTKLERVLRHFENVIDVKVLLSVDNHMQKSQCAELYVHMKGRGVFVESSDGDLYAAIDLLVDELDRQVVSHKSRLQEHHHDDLKYRSANMTPLNSPTARMASCLFARPHFGARAYSLGLWCCDALLAVVVAGECRT